MHKHRGTVANKSVTKGLGNRCLWCNTAGHARKDCGDLAEAIRANVVYLWNRRVHASETRRALDLNVGRGGMKRLMEEAAARHAEFWNRHRHIATIWHRQESRSEVKKSGRRRKPDFGR